MSDEWAKGRGEDPLINISDASEVRYWARKLGVTPDQLRAAVSQVGTQVKKVRDYLWELGE
jgi:hypothetical protein